METWNFNRDNDKKIHLVLTGEKTSYTKLYDGKAPEVGAKGILIFDNEKKACITEITDILVVKFGKIAFDMIKSEGEFKDIEDYKTYYSDYFKSIKSDFNLNDEVVLVNFKLVKNLIEKRLNIATKIVDGNRDIFGLGEHGIKEINAGFNNDIFEVDDKFIIKICSNYKLESKFLTEAQLYKERKNAKYLAKFYKYDNSKRIVPYDYEIMEKLHGKSLYYFWYKMSECEREKTISKLVDILKDFHWNIDPLFDWAGNIVKRIESAFEDTHNLFNSEEQAIIKRGFTKYNVYLSDYDLVSVHNDLHFDNIILDNGNLYLIDFNDVDVGPLDFDLRLLYMCQDTPWKWANTEMDHAQKPEDYKNIVTYLKKYYKEFAEIKFLDERMTIYKILNDIELLCRFRDNDELKNNIVNNSQILL